MGGFILIFHTGASTGWPVPKAPAVRDQCLGMPPQAAEMASGVIARDPRVARVARVEFFPQYGKDL